MKMRLGISSCLLGTKCRYDGASSKDSFIVEKLSKYFELVPYCPEAIIFGTPRESVRLVKQNNQIKVISNEIQKDYTKELQDICDYLALDIKKNDLNGFIFKSKSPSCGINSVKLFEENSDSFQRVATGLFAQSVIDNQPFLPVIEDAKLNECENSFFNKDDFLIHIFASTDLEKFLASKPSFKELVEFHTSYKYLIYTKGQIYYKELGNIVANHQHNDISEVLKEYQKSFLKAIQESSSVDKIYNVLLHIFGYFKNYLSKEQKTTFLNRCDEYKNSNLLLIDLLDILNLYVEKYDNDYLKTQKFLNPYPKELALTSDIKA